jgi:hypothetical protein
MLPSIGVRYGLVDGVDFGARVENFFSLGGDVKLRLHRGKIDLALDPGTEIIFASVSGTDSAGNQVTETAGVFYLHVPFLVGFNLSDVVTLVASPGISYALATNALPQASNAEQAGSVTQFLARLGLGVDIRLSDRFALHPEVTCMQGFTSAEVLMCIGGIGLNFGAQPNYDDLAPAPSELTQ